LYIHIADVAHYVEEYSKLDKEAFHRGTSVYLADRVIPMLPEMLSNHLCSLNTESEKLSLTCEAMLDRDGKLVQSTFHESIINSNFRLTYKEVDAIVAGKIAV
jgi:ribonuclease R